MNDLVVEKTKNLKNFLCIGDFGLPPSPSKDFLNKDQYIAIMKNFGMGNSSYKEEDGYHILYNVAHELIVNGREEWPVEYKFNSELFRCDHFTNSHKGLHILFSGCSVTEGIGINKEDTWSHRLYTKISKDKDVSGYFNLAHSGNGTHQIIGNFLEYIKRYGKPDVFFVLHPNIQRRYAFLNDEKIFTYNVELSTHDFSPTERDKHLTEFAAWAKIWNNFIKLCKVLNVKLIWGSWDNRDQSDIVQLEIFKESFLELYNCNDASELSEVLSDFKLEDKTIYARDNHPGPVSHYIWSNNFYDEVKKRNIL